MFTYHAKTYNLGFCSDAHCRVELLDQITALHPEIEKWFFIGDLVDFEHPWCNRNPDVEKWFPLNKDKFVFIKGNHDHVVAKSYIKVEHAFAWELARFHKTVKIVLPDKTEILLCHSKPNDFWEFIDIGVYTEREFIDDFCGHYDEDLTISVILGHNHKQFALNFPNVSPCIWSIGAVKDGYYATLREDRKIQFNKLPNDHHRPRNS
jgi:predicted phosphodiesterase